MKISLLPPNSSKLEKDIEQSTSFDLPIESITSLWNADTCPTNFLYVMGLMLGITNWDDNWSETVKRDTLKKAYSSHKIKGTPLSIHQAIAYEGHNLVDIAEGLNLESRTGHRSRNGHFYREFEHAWCLLMIYLDKQINTTQAKKIRQTLNYVIPMHCELSGLHLTAQDFLKDSQIYHDGNYTRGTY